MATIGTFTKNSDGSFSGAINTLSLNVRAASFRPNEKTDPKSPDYRIFAGKAELGAAWLKTGDNGDFLSVKLDDPSFPAAIYASLVEMDEVHSLIWSRSRSAH
ncbi:DUF736 domain-containing protein [Phenylobacterium sp.]|uniref:DUF736 domain-containing protein n=1 Tax=Phenylobacterium sp. TaxID=1871053 RepID=UPI001221C35E|nr:DUF736 domain-containing protein [Phenylobacterium sp.]THD57463.1 MAG: DUF736 domain-containing protein [Phenylobacterium sp.]